MDYTTTYAITESEAKFVCIALTELVTKDPRFKVAAQLLVRRLLAEMDANDKG